MEAPDGVILKAMVNGVQNGRDGKGSLFVFAAGNGGGVDDQCNFDGYTNSIFSMTIGAVDRKGLHPYYSELCAAMMVVAPSSGSGDHIVSLLTSSWKRSTDINVAYHRCWQGQMCTYTWRYLCSGTSSRGRLCIGIVCQVSRSSHSTELRGRKAERAQTRPDLARLSAHRCS